MARDHRQTKSSTFAAAADKVASQTQQRTLLQRAEDGEITFADLAYQLEKAGYMEAAEDAFRRARIHDETGGYQLFSFYLRQERLTDAVAFVEETIAINPAFARRAADWAPPSKLPEQRIAWMRKAAEVGVKSGRMDLLRITESEIMRLSPDERMSLGARLLEVSGLTYLLSPDGHPEIAAFDKPGDALEFRRLARLRETTGDHAGAVISLEDALADRSPYAKPAGEESKIRTDLAWKYRAVGMPDLAEQVLRKGAWHAPELLLGLARFQEVRGNYLGALASFAQLLKRDEMNAKKGLYTDAVRPLALALMDRMEQECPHDIDRLVDAGIDFNDLRMRFMQPADEFMAEMEEVAKFPSLFDYADKGVKLPIGLIGPHPDAEGLPKLRQSVAAHMPPDDLGL